MTRYSQNDEQDFILNFFQGQTGRYLDIGAYDGITFSNTRALAELGWNGVLIEPDPFNACKLIQNRLPNQTIILAAVSDEDLLTPLNIETYPDRGWASGISQENLEAGHVRELAKGATMLPTITPDDLVDLSPFEFISLDAEWMDFKILRVMPGYILSSCRLLSIEPRGMEERVEIVGYMFHKGWKNVHNTPENALFAHA